MPRGHSDAGYTASNGVSCISRGERSTSSNCSRLSQAPGSGTREYSLMPPLGTRRDVYSCTKDESRDKSSIFETMITAEPHGADRSADCFCCCRCIHSPPMNRSKYSAQVPYSNEPTVAYVHPPMERPMERYKPVHRYHKIHRRTNPESRMSPARLSLRDFCHSPFVRG